MVGPSRPWRAAGERGRVEAPLVVGRDGLGHAQPEVAQHQVDGVVPLLAHQHPHPRVLR